MSDIEVVEQIIRRQETRYTGKFRAFVARNDDPERRGRLKLIIPSVLGEVPSDWALPCFPYGGAAQIGSIAVPPKDAQVVAEFLGDVLAHARHLIVVATGLGDVDRIVDGSE